jgi:glycosyltransferase involved in cell wall biosynthesis
MTGPRCLIYERDVTGHRLQHVRHLTEALLETGCDVVLALQSDAPERDEYKVHLGPLESHFQLRHDLNPVQRGGYSFVAQRIDELLGAISREQPDWVYVPYADMMTQAAAVRSLLHGSRDFRATPIEGQVMRGRYAYPAGSLRAAVGSSASRWLTQRSPWRVTHLLDTWVYNNLQGTGSGTEFRLIPEPVEPLPQVDRLEARRLLGIPMDGRYVATTGLMEPRKGIDLLLAAFARAKVQQDDRLLLVGRMHQAIRDLISRDYQSLLSAGRIVIVDRYVSDFELGCGFMAGDVLVTPHPAQVGSSGTLVRTAAAQRPIIASNFGWVGWVTQKFELGAAVDVTDPIAFAAAIESALNSTTAWRRSEKAERFCRYHTVKNQKAHWLVSLSRNRNLALGDLANRIDWSWVTESCK